MADETFDLQWSSSDKFLNDDPIAAAKVLTPFDPPGDAMTESGIILPDVEDDEANEQAAALVLAQLAEEEDEDPDGETGETEDDDTVEDDDATPVEEI